MKYRAFQISAVHANGSAINGTVHVERTGKSYSFDFLADRTDDGAPLVRLYQAGTRPRVVPLNQLRDVRNAVREHFAKAPPPAAPVASDPVPADVPCYLAVSTDDAGVETVLGVFRVAEHASAAEAEREAGKLCDRIRAASRGSDCDVIGTKDTAFEVARELHAAGYRETPMRCIYRKEGARDALIVAHGSQFRRKHVGPVREAAPAMVPQVAQQQQANAGKVDAAFAALERAQAELDKADPEAREQRTAWDRAFDARESARDRAVRLDPIRYVRAYPSQAYGLRHLLPADMVARIEAAEDDAAMRAAVGAPAMVPQPCQPQQARARGRAQQPARGERRYVTVRDTETGEVHRVLTSVARVGFAVVVFVPSNRHRQGELGGRLLTHDDTRKAWVFNNHAEARDMLSRNRAPGERVIPAELVSDPAL